MKDSKTKVHDGEWKKISFGEFDGYGRSELPAHANAYITDLVDELLREQDIEPSAFAFSIAVDYLEGEDEQLSRNQSESN